MAAAEVELIHESPDRVRLHLGDAFLIILRRDRYRWIAHERRELWCGGALMAPKDEKPERWPKV